ncbi:MAG: F0F1 ATP synthase subunit B [Chloroflexota bacterium]|jgi:F-type H+-transporting ATPase subunit b|nr:F0F1 ATP synthase subunit B [Chloroflexota bacterium]MEC9321903.1 F0F1 ATP synthase subunit B [Chloroflexota bacterium]MEC9437858.1 F0F1 ATP synthase subunit B [Chloroflexota bacterium]MQF65739.1 F0F1 ATP synthase subunit B [SAR202 cluster bacterium AC-647-P02_OGT_505m]PKB60090.1 MAG: ATP synthase F0 subunit B [SAR202 cluster bacterium Ae2-Chloro-G1]|tara:strand:- start:7880 stop:8377 length:498 start_codon:yes stop_codon:yes gene_type:complete
MDALGINLPGLVTQIISFGILFFILSKLLYKPLVSLMDQRAEKIREGLEASNIAREEAARSEEAIQEQLSEARVEGQKLVAEARETADRFREEEMARVRDDIELERVRAEANIQRERDAAIEDLRKEFAGLAISAAEKVVRTSLDEDGHKELIESVLEESTSGNN